MKNLKRIIFGIILVVAGTIFALNALEITDIDIFFEGWWTLFIIVPCFLNLVSGHDVAGNIAGHPRCSSASLHERYPRLVYDVEALYSRYSSYHRT